MKALAFLLILASVALGGWALWEHSERVHAQEQLASVTRERDRFQKSARESISKLTMAAGADVKSSGPTGLSEQLKDLGITLNDEDKKKPDKDSKGKVPSEMPPQSDVPDLAKFLKDPAMKQALRVRAEAQLEMIYGDFFKEMRLDESKQDAVLAILKERQGAQTDLGLSVFDKGLSPDDRKAVAEKLSKSAKDAEAKLKAALGDEYPPFEQFEKSAPEREQLSSFNSMLKDKDLTIEESLKKKLLDIMFQERQGFKFDRDLSDLKSVSPDTLTETTVDRYMAQNLKLQEQVRSKVKGLLSEEQYEFFLKAQENHQRSAQTNLHWLRQLASGKEPEARD